MSLVSWPISILGAADRLAGGRLAPGPGPPVGPKPPAWTRQASAPGPPRTPGARLANSLADFQNVTHLPFPPVYRDANSGQTARKSRDISETRSIRPNSRPEDDAKSGDSTSFRSAGRPWCPLAALLLEEGHRVTGSDRPLYPPMSTTLERLGIPVAQGFSPEHVPAGLRRRRRRQRGASGQRRGRRGGAAGPARPLAATGGAPVSCCRARPPSWSRARTARPRPRR